jgi:hypothetical protein
MKKEIYVKEIDAFIDKSLIKIIKTLNKLGYTTEYCCSGLYQDHLNTNFSCGYISFLKNLKPSKKEIIKKAAMIYLNYYDWDENCIVYNALPTIKINHKIHDEIILKRWKDFIKNVKDRTITEKVNIT